LYGPDGTGFATYLELVEQWEQEHQRADRLAAQLRALGVEPEQQAGTLERPFSRHLLAISPIIPENECASVDNRVRLPDIILWDRS
jgi:hypothetical protein